MPELILTDDHHYFLDNKPIDGLTSTLQEAGLMGNYGSEWHMDRGTKIHLATQYWDQGTLDESTIDPQISGYIESWRRFRKDMNYTPTHVEYQIYHPELMVASKVDRIPLLDIKSGSQAPWHALQIAFQWVTLKILDPSDDAYPLPSWQPKTVYLDPDGGSPKVKLYKSSELREAFKIYSSLLVFVRWKREKGVKNGTSRTNDPPRDSEGN